MNLTSLFRAISVGMLLTIVCLSVPSLRAEESCSGCCGKKKAKAAAPAATPAAPGSTTNTPAKN